MSSHSLSPHNRTTLRRPSQHRLCDFGNDHISKLAFDLAHEENENRLRNLRSELREKEEELLTYHNDLAACQTRINDLEEKLGLSQKEKQELEKEVDQSLEDYNKIVEDCNISNAAAEKNAELTIEARAQRDNLREELKKSRDLEKELRAQIKEIATERDSLKTTGQKRDRSPGPVLTEENKRLKTESQDIRKRLTRILGQEEKDLPDQHNNLLALLDQKLKATEEALAAAERREKLNSAFTPPPETALEQQLREWEEAARFCANTAAQSSKQPTPTPQELREIVNGLKDQEEHADRLAIENQAIIFAWENASLQLLPQKHDIPLAPEKFVEQVRRQGDLSILRNLHPSLEKVEGTDIKSLVTALSDTISWELSSLWQYLPHDKDEALVTPSSRLGDLLERVKAAVIKQNQNPDAKLSRKLQKENNNLVKDLNAAQDQVKEKGPLLDFLIQLITRLVQDGATRRSQ
jgi:hypothetical protein